MAQLPGDLNTPDWPPQEPAPSHVAEARTSGYAIASLVCGICGMVTCCLFVPSILAIVFGAVALPAIRQGQAHGRGLAISGIVLGIIGTAVGVAVWIVVALAPEGAPIPGDTVPDSDRRVLESLGALNEGEQIDLFYASGMFSIKEGGAVITENRFVLYHGPQQIEAYPLSDIRAIEYAPAVDWFDDGQFMIECDDGELLFFSVNTQDSGDKLFHRVLTRKVSEARQNAGKPPVASEISPVGDSEQADHPQQ